MPFGLRTFGMKIGAGMAAASLLLVIACPAARADDLRAAYESQAGYALHLLEAGRYSEAEDAAQNLVTAYPNAALPYDLRGTTALYVGSLGLARKDFNRAAGISSDDETLYGLALCDLFAHDTAGAKDKLAVISGQAHLSEPQASDVQAAQAYVAFLRGGSAEADKAGDMDSSLRSEIAALALMRVDPKAGALSLAKFLATPDGVPRVREEDGMHPLFDPKTPLEPSVIPPDLQQMYADRLAGNIANAARHTGQVQSYSGVVDLNPPQTLPSQTAILSYSVDGQMAAMVNQPPYTFTWNTARVANGTHTVEMRAVDALGNSLATQTETVRVSNQNDAVSHQADDPGMEALKVRLWNLLALRPCRKVAEWTLAQASLAAGDRVSADAHLLNAAALDPRYKNGSSTAYALFGPPASLLNVWIGSSKRKEIALTFDDGPSLSKTPALLDALDKAHAPATFFVVGSRAALVPDILRRMARSGDEVENHSYTHPNMNLVLPSEAESEIVRGNVLIQALTGRQPHFFRPPGGNADPAVQRLAQLNGLTVAYWSLDALHYEDLGSPSALVRSVLAHVHPGSIVLMHDGPDVTTEAIPALAAGLRAMGYSLVTLSEVAKGQTNAAAKTLPKMKE